MNSNSIVTKRLLRTAVQLSETVIVCLFLAWGCSSTPVEELRALAVESIERVDSLSEGSYVAANTEMQHFTGLIKQLRKKDDDTDWVQVVLAQAEVHPEVINPLRYNIDPARQYAMLAKAEMGLFHLAALWNLTRVPLWETDRVNQHLMEGMLDAAEPDLAIEVLAMIPPDDQRSAAIDAVSLWFARHATDSSAATPTEESIALLVELTLEIRPLAHRTLAILNTGSLLEDLGYEDEAEGLAAKGLAISGEDQQNPFVASAAFNNIGRAIRPDGSRSEDPPDPESHPQWNELTEANELLRTCQSDSQRVTLLIELAAKNLTQGNEDLGLQQLDVAQMFLQVLDSDKMSGFINEKLLQAARVYASAGQIASALRVLSDRRLELADTWVSLTLTDIAAEFVKKQRELDGTDKLALHQFIRDEILYFEM